MRFMSIFARIVREFSRCLSEERAITLADCDSKNIKKRRFMVLSHPEKRLFPAIQVVRLRRTQLRRV
jgi:hypothetical protein